MSFASLRRVLRSARKGLCSTCAKTRYPQLEAAGAGHVGCLIYTLETLGQLITDEHRVTAMHVAARKGQISVLIYLVENDMVNEVPRAKNGATPAHDAAGTGNLDCLRYLMKQTNINVNDADGAGQTILHWAVLSGHLETVQFLVLEGQAAIDAADRNGLTTFHIAAVKNNLPILKFLAAYAYKRHPKPQRLLNAKNKSGLTPICCAAQAGHVEIVRWLATKGGGDPTVPTSHGTAPLHVATMAGKLEVVKYLYQFGSATAFGGLRTSDGSSALHLAASSGFIDIMKWLLEQKHTSGDEVDHFQRTPLHYAAESGQLKAIQVLCEHGVNVLLEDEKGNLAVQVTNDSKCIKYLETAMKKRKPAMGTGSLNHSKAKVTDGPEPPPLQAFIEEEEIPIENDDPNGEGWETLQDLMNQSEIQQLNMVGPGYQPTMQKNAEMKRRELEERLRREEEEKGRKREELLRLQEENAKKIRQQLIEEDPEDKLPPVGQNGRVAAGSHASRGTGDKQASKQLKSSGQESNPSGEKSESDSKDFASDKGGKGLFSKFWSKKNETRPTSPPLSLPHPTKGSLQPQDPTLESLDEDHGDLEGIKPRAPRRRTKEPEGGKENTPAVSDFLEVKGPTPVPSSSPPRGRRGLQRKPTPHPYRQVAKVPGAPEPASPTPVPVKMALNYDSTPLSSPSSESVNSVSPFNSPSPAPSLSPPMSPLSSFQNITGRPQSPIPATPIAAVTKRTAPPPPAVPPPSAPVAQPSSSSSAKPPSAKPPSLPNGFRAAASDSALLTQPKPFMSRQNSLPGTLPPSSSPPRADSPTMDDMENQLEDVLKILATNLSMYERGKPHPSNGEANEEQGDEDSGSGSSSSSEEDEEGEEEEEEEDDEEEEEERGSSPNEGKKHLRKRRMTPPITVQRPVMARNAGMNRTVQTAGLNNVRKQTRYPRLLRKKVVNLDTIDEIQDEIIHEAYSEEEQAYCFYRIHTERNVVQAWRRYVILARITQRKAQAMLQKRQKDHLSKVFTAWRQALKYTFPDTEEEEESPNPQPVVQPSHGATTVRSLSGTTARPMVQSLSGTNLQRAAHLPNGTTAGHKGQPMDVKVKHSVSMGTISNTSLNRAISSSVQSIPQLSPKEAYIQWMNKHLETQHKSWQDVMTSLHGGGTIIQALATASGRSAPRYNPNPKLALQRLDNWRVAYEFMKSIGVNVKGIEPADLAEGSEPAVCSMFSSIVKWQDSPSNNYSVL